MNRLGLLVLGMLCCASTARAGIIPPTQDFFPGSDVVGWQLPSDIQRRVLFPERGTFPADIPMPVPQFEFDLHAAFGVPPIPAPVGAADRYVRLTEPVSGATTDILAVKVAAGILTLHFWSDDPQATDPIGSSANAFLDAVYGAANVPAVPFRMLPETGGLQDVNALLFPVLGSSPFVELFVASDVNDQPIVDPGKRIFGSSDFLALATPGKRIVVGALPQTGPEVANVGTMVNVTFTLPPGGFFVPGPGTLRSKRLNLWEDFVGGILSDILIMKSIPGPVDPDNGNQSFTLQFGLWSEDPFDPTAAQFLANAGPVPVTFNELEAGHRDLKDLFFQEIIPGRRPFNQALVGSDPPIPAPAPSTLLLLVGGCASWLLVAWRRRGQAPTRDDILRCRCSA